MTIAVYLSALIFGCCVLWMIAAAIGLMPIPSQAGVAFDVSWRRVWLSVLTAAASGATFLIIRFVEDEAPVSAYVVARGWLGFFVVLGVVSALSAGLMMVVASGVRRSRQSREHEPSAR